MLKLREVAKNFYRMEIGNGRHISFWYDKWSDKGIIAEVLGDRGMIGLGIRKEATLAEAALRFRRKRKHRLEFLNELERSLDTVRSLICNESEDISTWRGKMGYKPNFSTRETWDKLREVNEKQMWAKGVWFSMATPKFAFIVWLAMKNRLSTMDRIAKWSQGVDNVCVLCHTEAETRDHLFFKCSYSDQLWRYLVGGILGSSYTDGWTEIVQKTSGSTLDKKSLFCLRYALQAATYAIWRERNRVKHGERLTPLDILKKITEKGIRNKLSLIRMKRGRGMENALQYWFQTRGV